MFINRFRLLYSFSSVRPTSGFPVYNTHLRKCFCTERKRELKPEDTFGDYITDWASRNPSDYCEDDTKSDITIIEAIHKIRKHVNAYEFDEANEVFNELKKTKRPPPYVYKLLFASAARLGKLEEAFKIYNDLKKRGLYADGAMYTSLFYACAKSPRSDIALPIADKLLEYMLNSKKHKPNMSNFNAAIMAYGRHGDISTVMNIVDKLEEERNRLSCNTYNFALESCISEKNSGLRYAILIWHHMLRKKILPNSYTFTTLVRCVRDCSLGDSDLCEQFIKSVFENCSKKKIRESQRKELHSGQFVINLKEEEESQQLHEADQKGGDVGSTNDFDNRSKNILTDRVIDVQIKQAEVIDAAGNTTADDESDEKLQCSHSVKAESSNNCSLAIGNNEESLCVTNVQTEPSEIAASLPTGNNVDVIDIEDQGQVTEVSSVAELNSKSEIHHLDDSELPNLLTRKPPGTSIMKFGDFSTPENRLMLFGGLNGFLETMKDYKAKPDVVLFSMLLECIPSTEEDETALMKAMKRFSVKVDTTFLNILIKRRILRKVELTPEDFIDLFKKYGCAPDVITFGTIAYSCKTHESGIKCIQLARSHNIRMNGAIAGCLLENAGKIRDMAYVSDILKAAKEDDTQLDARFVSSLKYIVDKEKKNRRNRVS